jgi:uncharacterized protein DUF1761
MTYSTEVAVRSKNRVEVSYKAALVAAAAAWVVGATEWTKPLQIQRWEVLGEFGRSLLIAYVFARLLVLSRVANWKGAIVLGGWVWFGFQATILLGSVIHEHMPLTAYAIRAGYALASDAAIIAILGVWRRGTTVVEPGENEASINYKAILLAAVAAIVLGALWYSPALFGGAWANLKATASAGGASIPPAEVLAEFVRSAIVAYVLARLVVLLRIVSWKGTMLLASWAWLGFHATLLLFSVIHEQMPLKLFAIHAGHGLANDLVIAAIVGGWRLKRRRRDCVSGAGMRSASTFPSGALQE